MAQGPPFDPLVLNLARHQVFLTPSEPAYDWAADVLDDGGGGDAGA